jgi:hypothetical protein
MHFAFKPRKQIYPIQSASFLQRLNPVMSNKNKGLLVIWHHIVYDVKEN